jgi:hypothetical protein
MNGNVIDFAERGDQIDFESIIIYGAEYAGQHIMENGETWKAGENPSQGDIDAVKSLYPDLEDPLKNLAKA